LSNNDSEKSNILVSVLTPAYNATPFLEASANSILDQTYTHFELIIVDDGSRDGTWALMEQLAAKDSRVRIYRNSHNLGIAGTRNRLKSLAQGKYIAWQDADDISLPSRLADQFALMESDPAIGICGGGLQFFDDRGELHKRLYASADEDLRASIFRYSPVAQPAAMIRKSVLDQVGDYDLNYPPAEDLDMSFRIGMVSKFANIAGLAIRYRETSTGATFTRLKLMELNTISIRLRYAHSKHYAMTFADHVYNICQYVSIFVIPSRLKIAIFSFFRNSK
jgi:glycosyltransferase involved in cell wall biosynthesis